MLLRVLRLFFFFLQNNPERDFQEVRKPGPSPLRMLLKKKRKRKGTPAAAPHLKTPHVSRVPCVLQAVLVALQEELEEEPAGGGRDSNRKANESVTDGAAVCHRGWGGWG